LTVLLPSPAWTLSQPSPSVTVLAPLLSLPGILGTTPETVPAKVPYLTADARLVEHYFFSSMKIAYATPSGYPRFHE
jgi:hypothetical protein